MVWWIFVTVRHCANVECYIGCREGGMEHFTYHRLDKKEHILGTKTHVHVPGGEFIEVRGQRPELQQNFAEYLQVHRVNAIGTAPRHVMPGMYGMIGATAEVTSDGRRRKLTIDAKSCEKALKLYEELLANPDAICAYSYAA